MAKPKEKPAVALRGAEEFAGGDTTDDALTKIEAATKAAAIEAEQAKKKGDNGGPLLDEDAWKRACVEYSAEMLDMEDLEVKKSEIAGRISSIRKVAKKAKVNWDLVKRYHDDHKAIRKGGMGAMVTDERQYRHLLKLMGSPLGTQFSLWEVEATTEGEAAAPKDENTRVAEATLAGEHAGRNAEPKDNNTHTPGTPEWFGWNNGWQVGTDAAIDGFKGGPAANP